ncbi:MAG: bifunctional ornithine acetyltransferase/N-acetylglutamate synthase, partial [Planctomycetota bacterium]
ARAIADTVAGMAKGAGMIAPNMATMLATVMTDFPLSQDRAQAAIHRAAQHSFNCISVDGHASTNDTLLLLSSHPVETDGDPSVEESEILAAGFGEFEKVLTQVCEYLARRIVLDGEGAGRIFEINIGGATNDGDARAIADTVANSNLVKTAIHGCDPNWGRIMSAVGNAAADVELSRCSLKINDQLVFENGAPVSFDAVGVSDSMRNTDTVMLDIVVGDATGTSTVWASDLGIDYVTFNSEYTT